MNSLYERNGAEFDPLERRLAHEHLQVDALCASDPEVSYSLPEAELPPRAYRIAFHGVKSIVGLDAEMLPIFGTEHVLEIRLGPGYPVEAPLCYMVSPVWHPNIQSEPGPFQGRICGNTEGFGAFYALEELILRIKAILKYEMYHAQLRLPYPEDENVARWVREYAEPLGIVSPGIGIREDHVLPANWRQHVRREEKMRIRIS